MMENGSWGLSKGLEFGKGLMESNMKVIGIKEKHMVKGSINI